MKHTDYPNKSMTISTKQIQLLLSIHSWESKQVDQSLQVGQLVRGEGRFYLDLIEGCSPEGWVISPSQNILQYSKRTEEREAPEGLHQHELWH